MLTCTAHIPNEQLESHEDRWSGDDDNERWVPEELQKDQSPLTGCSASRVVHVGESDERASQSMQQMKLSTQPGSDEQRLVGFEGFLGGCQGISCRQFVDRLAKWLGGDPAGAADSLQFL